MAGDIKVSVPFETLLGSIAELSLEDKVLLRESLDEQIREQSATKKRGVRGKYAHVATSSEEFARHKREEIALEGERR